MTRTALVLGKQHIVGSGVIVDPQGYIVTNAHVVSGAERIQVSLLPAASPHGGKPGESIENELSHAFAAPVEATLIGVFKEADLALLKIPVSGLPVLPYADHRKLRQGQVVFAFGSRDGLSNSVSMGVVSSVARQPNPDSPFIFIQTDAAVNPGDSGGPLVNTAGEMVGLNTFILSQSGGSEGIAFAIPTPLIRIVSDQLRKRGHFHRLVMGVGVQSLTPTLAAGLQLPRSSGVLVSDIAPGSPAEADGLKLNDIVLTLDGNPVQNLPQFMMASLTHSGSEAVRIQVLRKTEILLFEVTAVQEEHTADRVTDLLDPVKGQIAKLGVLGITVDDKLAAVLSHLRSGYGVLIAARSEGSADTPGDVQVGDVVHEVNGEMVPTVEALRAKLDQMKRGDPVALFIERDGVMQYVSFELE